MTAIKNGQRPDPAEPYEPESIEVLERSDGKLSLVLRVKIEGRLRRILLSPDALQDFDLSGPEAVKELRRIREAVEALASREHRQNR